MVSEFILTPSLCNLFSFDFVSLWITLFSLFDSLHVNMGPKKMCKILRKFYYIFFSFIFFMVKPNMRTIFLSNFF